MGTRSTVKFYDEGKLILSVYQQYDGYLSGVGRNLAEWLKDKKIVNGFVSEDMKNGFANGMGCLAAQYVAANKTSIGSFYITKPGDEQEFNYQVYYIDNKIIIDVNEFKGTPDEFLNYIE